MQVGMDTFVAAFDDKSQAVDPSQRVQDFLDQVELAERVGLDTFGVGEHHRKEFLDSAPTILLAAAAARTKKIRLLSAVTVLSSQDPVRVFQSFATLDLISRGRAEMVVGRGSFSESFPLFGYRLEDYDELFDEKIRLLLKIRESEHVTWSGKFRPPLHGEGIYPRPVQNPLPIWVGVGGTPTSFVRAGVLGLPLMVAIIGGQPEMFRSGVELYREAGRRSGFDAKQLRVGVHVVGYVAETSQKAADDFFPGWARAMTDIGRERGWGPMTRAHFEAEIGPEGALIVGDPDEVAEKIARYCETLGGIERITFMTNVAGLPQERMLQSIELLGKQVAPRVRERLSRS